MFTTITVCKWITVRKINLVVFMLELDLKSKGIIVATSLLFEVVLVVCNFMAVSLPLLVNH